MRKNSTIKIGKNLQKNISLNTFNNIINDVQNSIRVVCDEINYQYNVSRVKVSVKLF